MTLLIFLAGLAAQFRFVSTVTILQQTIRCRCRFVIRRGGQPRERPRAIAGCRLL